MLSPLGKKLGTFSVFYIRDHVQEQSCPLTLRITMNAPKRYVLCRRYGTPDRVGGKSGIFLRTWHTYVLFKKIYIVTLKIISFTVKFYVFPIDTYTHRITTHRRARAHIHRGTVVQTENTGKQTYKHTNIEAQLCKQRTQTNKHTGTHTYTHKDIPLATVQLLHLKKCCVLVTSLC